MARLAARGPPAFAGARSSEPQVHTAGLGSGCDPSTVTWTSGCRLGGRCQFSKAAESVSFFLALSHPPTQPPTQREIPQPSGVCPGTLTCQCCAGPGACTGWGRSCPVLSLSSGAGEFVNRADSWLPHAFCQYLLAAAWLQVPQEAWGTNRCAVRAASWGQARRAGGLLGPGTDRSLRSGGPCLCLVWS